MKKLFAILLTLAMLLSLAACGGGEEDPNAGKYMGTTATVLGFTMEIAEVYPGDNWVELKSGGKGTIKLGEDEFPMKWSLEGENITITISGEDSVGTLKDGLITIDFMNMGCELSFLKEGAEPPAPEVTYNDAGYWDIVRLDSEDPASSVSEEDMALVKAYDTFAYLDLVEDGTGTLYLDGEYPITWSDGSFTDEEGLVWEYTLEGDELHLAIDSNTFVFRRGEKPEPVVSEMEQAGFTSFIEVGVPYDYVTICSKDETKTTTAEAIVTSYEIFESADGYSPLEGYEWRVVKMEVRFYDENTGKYGCSVSSNKEDYYNTKLHDDTEELVEETDDYSQYCYTIIHNGQEMDAYEFYNYPVWSEWYTGENGNDEIICYLQWDFLVPVGYDGCVVGLSNLADEWADGTYITDYDPADFLLFRLN